jgi:long-chain acyl-CoA synthetase
MTLNLYDRFHQTARRQPASPAILGPPAAAAVSYRALDEAIVAAGERLHGAGVSAGDCVGLHLRSSLEYIVCTYAIWRCGGCVVPLPMELTDPETAEICSCLALDYAICPVGDRSLAPFRSGAASELLPRSVVTPLHRQREHPAGFAQIHSAFIRFTSGTTGASKGVVLSHESIAQRIAAANEVLAIGPGDRVLWVLSMSYHFTVSIVAYLSLGAAIVLPENHFASAVTEAIVQRRATLLYASPMHFALLADYPAGQRLESLRLAVSSTASLDQGVAERFRQRYGRPISQALGIIEVGLPCIDVDPSPQRAGTVGRLLPAYRLRMEEVGLGPELREVLLAGPGFLDAYYHPFQTRDEIMLGGWFRTGDVGQLDDDGYLFLKGRSKEVISVMGMKFFPQEVERVLTAHPAVAAATVFARGDSRRGETVHACVVPQNGGGGDLPVLLRQFCQQRLAAYKIPREIELVSALPQTASGKILHREPGRRAPALSDA